MLGTLRPQASTAGYWGDKPGKNGGLWQFMFFGFKNSKLLAKSENYRLNGNNARYDLVV
jgi:hypothetical protein